MARLSHQMARLSHQMARLSRSIAHPAYCLMGEKTRDTVGKTRYARLYEQTISVSLSTSTSVASDFDKRCIKQNRANRAV